MNLLFFKTTPTVERILVEDSFFNTIAKFRYNVYCDELGFLDSKKYKDKRETDDYDGESIHIAVKIGNRLVGYCRIILSKSDGKLPVFTEYGLNKRYLIEPSCEVSRFMISKRYRNKTTTRREIFRLLAEEILEVVDECEIKCLFAVVEEWLYLSLKKRGYNFVKLDEGGKDYMGAKTFPIRLKINE